MISHPLLLAATLAGIMALGFWLDRRYRWARTVGATLLIILFGALLSNAGLVPGASPVYDFITGPVTSLAIVWLLFAVDLRDLKTAGPRMLAAFGIAVAGTAAGACVATLLFADALGGETWKLAGVMTGTYAGGGLNFVAVGREVGLSPAIFGAATAADNLMTGLWMGATLLLPLWLKRYYVEAPEAIYHVAGTGPEAGVGSGDGIAAPEAAAPPAGASRGGIADEDHPFFADAPLRIIDLSVLFGLGLFLVWLSELVGERTPGIPAVLWLTTLALIVGQLGAVQGLAGAMQLGNLALHLFLAVIGIWARIAEMLRVGPEVFYFTATVVLVHGVVIYGVAKLARLDVETASVASQAAVGGPSSALALAVARDWPGLILPGIVAGLLGYAAGNYVAFAVAYAVRAVLGG